MSLESAFRVLAVSGARLPALALGIALALLACGEQREAVQTLPSVEGAPPSPEPPAEVGEIGGEEPIGESTGSDEVERWMDEASRLPDESELYDEELEQGVEELDPTYPEEPEADVPEELETDLASLEDDPLPPVDLGFEAVVAERTYTVRPGDTLGTIAAAEYGDSSKYRLIYDANREHISDPNRVEPGQLLVLP